MTPSSAQPAANWFLALPLPPGCGWERSALGAPPELRRFDPLDLHLTVAFLGPCGEAAALAAWEAVAPLRHGEITATAGAWRAMGPAAAPSAYALGLDLGAAELAVMLACWGPLALAAAGRPAERRAPLPHVTLMRPRRRDGQRLRQPLARWMAAAPLPSGPVSFSEIALYTWTLDRRERLFRIQARRPLAG
ncbi:hypothetical protein KBZ20_00185 [Vulcanococcus limneticus Candia 3F8]|uniref:2'-5' RNA ligase family protein n=1 Tax=Vulcanococcus limneticus TaxID=2170428 RepID=UPI000B99D14C|nr:hypothetical protein [Vulcanococcus limneticus]MCP9790974.1 hypothetical protein [Vulcanococcus limneticus MW73D5]MCP9892198.1 hypothetical protein [Vulcanococcus limneticus Candia 3F8]MCP9895980.1 hypothetical protein [Vulcanococcus limneticus Candia 3B3]